jgi:cell fate regulator YaaT (PSP1 superfamily)
LQEFKIIYQMAYRESGKCDNRALIYEVPTGKLCGCAKLDSYNWMGHIPMASDYNELAEVRFKNTRKGFYRNVNGLRIKKGDIIAVEASPGHDIGIVSLTGELVLMQMKKYGILPDSEDLKKIYRKAKPADIDKWKETIELEHDTMIRSRKIAEKLNLAMKIGDVEYQGDKTKAIFYYIADERVDFRELIKVLADEFKIRIEMKQIGARQEAGRIGGIGSCGRELCCASWMTSFISVTTSAARLQEVSLNPQKLAGQCGKLKCCLNYEVQCYIDAQKGFPNKEIILETEKGPAYHYKSDIYRQIMWYGFEKGEEAVIRLIPVPIERVIEIIELNKQNKKVPDLIEYTEKHSKTLPDFHFELSGEDLSIPDELSDQTDIQKGNKNKNR